MSKRIVENISPNRAQAILVDLINTLIDIESNLEEGDIMTELERHLLETYTTWSDDEMMGAES